MPGTQAGVCCACGLAMPKASLVALIHVGHYAFPGVNWRTISRSPPVANVWRAISNVIRSMLAIAAYPSRAAGRAEALHLSQPAISKRGTRSRRADRQRPVGTSGAMRPAKSTPAACRISPTGKTARSAAPSGHLGDGPCSGHQARLTLGQNPAHRRTRPGRGSERNAPANRCEPASNLGPGRSAITLCS
jgi:hypothetical protein